MVDKLPQGVFKDVSDEFDKQFDTLVHKSIIDMEEFLTITNRERMHLMTVATVGKRGEEGITELYALIARADTLASKELHDLIDGLQEHDRFKARHIISRLIPLDLAELYILYRELWKVRENTFSDPATVRWARFYLIYLLAL